MFTQDTSKKERNKNKMHWTLPTREEIYKVMVLKECPVGLSLDKLLRIVGEHMISHGIRDRIVKDVVDLKVGMNMDTVLSVKGNKCSPTVITSVMCLFSCGQELTMLS